MAAAARIDRRSWVAGARPGATRFGRCDRGSPALRRSARLHPVMFTWAQPWARGRDGQWSVSRARGRHTGDATVVRVTPARDPDRQPE